MGATLRLAAWTADEAGAEASFGEVFREFERLENMMSVWREGSDLLRLNRAAGDHPVPVAPEMIEVLTQARQISDWTGGKFDVTFGALSGLWKFDQDQDNVVPDMTEVRRRLPLIDYRALEIDARAGTAFLARKGMSAHLGGIGKGLRDGSRHRYPPQPRTSHFLIPGGRRHVRGGLEGSQAVAPGYSRSTRPGGPSVRGARLVRRHVQHVRRLRAVLHQERPALPSHSGSRHRGTLPRLPQRDHRANRAVLADGLSTGVFLLGPEAGMALIERPA
jgi:thiamine biosynthesis lipoprotein